MNSKSARRIKRPAKFTDGEVGNELTVTDRNAPYVTVQFAEEDLEKDIYFLGDLKGVDNKEVEAFSTLKLGQQILARCSGNVYWEATIKAINGTSVQDGDCPAVKKLRNDAKREKNIKVKKGKILVSENEENGHRNKHKQHSGQKKKEVVRIPADREADKKVSSNAQKKKELQQEQRNQEKAKAFAANMQASQLFITNNNNLHDACVSDKNSNSTPSDKNSKSLSDNATHPEESHANNNKSHNSQPNQSSEMSLQNNLSSSQTPGNTDSNTQSPENEPSHPVSDGIPRVLPSNHSLLNQSFENPSFPDWSSNHFISNPFSANHWNWSPMSHPTINQISVNHSLSNQLMANHTTSGVSTPQTFSGNHTNWSSVMQTTPNQSLGYTPAHLSANQFTPRQTMVNKSMFSPFSSHSTPPQMRNLNPTELFPGQQFEMSGNFNLLSPTPMHQHYQPPNPQINRNIFNPQVLIPPAPSPQDTDCNTDTPDRDDTDDITDTTDINEQTVMDNSFMSSSIAVLENEMEDCPDHDSACDSMMNNSPVIACNSSPFPQQNPNPFNKSCNDCIKKDQEIAELKRKLREYEGAENQGIVSRTKAYRPKTKPEVDFADYVIVEKNRTAPEGFQLLCEGASIAVRPMWLEELLATINKARTKKLKKAARQNRDVKEDESSEIIKRLIDGFFEPSELAVQGGTSVFKDNPVYLSLKRYAVHVLKTNKTKFRRAWNTKMCAARQTVDRLSGKQKSN